MIEKYLNKEFILSIFVVLIGLIALFAFFDFMQEINDLGKGNYGLLQVFTYVLLSMPGRLYEVIPLAVLLGSMLAIGQLAASSELTVIRSSGFSIKKIAKILTISGMLFSFLTLAIGEFIAPNSEKNAQQIKINATASVVSQEFKSGFWIKDGFNFVNIENVLPNSNLEGINIYEFDREFNLRTITNSSTGTFTDGQWKLEKITQKIIFDEIVETIKIEKGSWKSEIRPEMMNALIISPEKMSIINLFKFINYLKTNHQSTTKYEVALWEKLIHPIIPIIMIIFAVPFGFFHERSGGKFFKIFIGIIAGISYQIINTMIRHLSLINDWQPFLSSLVPSLIFLSVGLLMIKRFEHK
jgi:lipopolysaccharide export system permease protein